MTDDIAPDAIPMDQYLRATAEAQDEVAAPDEEAGAHWEPNWWVRVLVAALAGLFLGAAVTVFVQERQTPGTSSVDVGFYQDMITHHEQAVQMSLLQLTNGTDDTLMGFAREILVFQNQQIGQMRELLRVWGINIYERPDTAMGWMGVEVRLEDMPGLASDDQMRELRNARGAEADQRFLQLMTDHHRGGLTMALYAADKAKERAVRDLAGLMASVQYKEMLEYDYIAKRKGIPLDLGDLPPLPAHLRNP